MKHFLVLLMGCVLTLGLAAPDADAKRMGGGKSFGSFSRQAPAKESTRTFGTTSTQKQNGVQNATSGRKGMGFLGPLAGLAAGGLLASMFFGGAFDGIQPLDILLMAGLAFLLFRFLRRRQPQTRGAHHQAGAEQSPPPSHFERHSSASSGGALNEGQAARQDDQHVQYGAPAWFDEAGFVERARQHFHDLQAAWDSGDMAQIQEYVTPLLYQQLCEERQKQAGQSHTVVDKLAVEISQIQQVGETVELAVMFHGMIAEDGAAPAPFREMWHLIRDMKQQDAPWVIQGIEQLA
ncbi:hypothetical protein BFW38_00020 [Terasakiispira papahanaumokuakeensis]|uniref:Tim44-like domain-containing protein n=1 Tax=Terasakiispira papahanaumokuakeensis TaxID=197479 RepID=A0A1E2V599_9GAMM|nr:Tim44-like domain-containing protein [Terasakiispira papahanaumokuakeensis]ODC02169.1 hypothetical protein BFW38_00020 [Terasakiispira papahanaumokuakeensis]